ncbi:unnamed protein product [Lactuca virosa]|uniref:Uncharacterized protein n=1 Tax=Lactuca virosa TaxID=75947 RepID=A0AAU9PTM3_9ASTR|nr:unnamed protein product [Lactuca virosa]
MPFPFFPTDIPVNREEVVVVALVEPPAEANHCTFRLVIASFYKCIAHIVNILEPLHRLWINYYLPTFGESAVIMPPSPLSFIITSLYAFADIKSQGSEFPFNTHPRSINVAITSLLFYGLASGAEHFICVSRLGPTSVYAIIARLGRISCLCVLVASLASLFYL